MENKMTIDGKKNRWSKEFMFSKYQKYRVDRTHPGTYGFVGECGKKDYGCDNSADYLRIHGRGLLSLCKNCKEKEEKNDNI
jgi:hypothetical protein